jgi:Sec7-like guanine-nucleotide exchange factor
MAKVITKYRAYTASELESRASNTCDMVVSGNNVNCTDITTAKIRNVLSESTNAVGELSDSALVNVYSGFGPTIQMMGI